MDYRIIPLNEPGKPKTLSCPVTETLFDCGPEKDAPCPECMIEQADSPLCELPLP
ncbi:MULTISPECIES: hypothetical protein [Kosmotoga]|jgi:hypothetical protein|uniref:Uncharacterized protein n=1 Tax=Kosmotoga olearia (strain ATCC BAA-1733 / DSM 21960 / TBF 19.5.1) TaxID=521045 RepID=C5CG43_KOSOT|nr:MULTISPECIES: hypothetical protein [Kosmotoga]ACR79484.1 hypothetical protein Kole_0772 [Kosmotoga olearia TBF 19.5.1]